RRMASATPSSELETLSAASLTSFDSASIAPLLVTPLVPSASMARAIDSAAWAIASSAFEPEVGFLFMWSSHRLPPVSSSHPASLLLPRSAEAAYSSALHSRALRVSFPSRCRIQREPLLHRLRRRRRMTPSADHFVVVRAPPGETAAGVAGGFVLVSGGRRCGGAGR